jgi:hypothetical protein
VKWLSLSTTGDQPAPHTGQQRDGQVARISGAMRDVGYAA